MRPNRGGPDRRRPVMLDSPLQRRHKPDYLLVVLPACLLVVGLVVIYAISPGLSEQRQVGENYFIGKQAISILLGLVGLIIAANVPLARWKQFQKPLIVVAAVATLIALVTPVTPEYPAHRWIRFAGLSLQSVELVKFALLLWLAYFLAQRAKQGELDDKQKTFKPLGIVFLVVAVAVDIYPIIE